MYTQNCKRPTRNRKPVYFPHFGNILNELMNSPIDRVIHEKKVQFNRPMANIFDHEDQYEIHLALPGISKSQIELNLEKDVLSIKGSVESKEETKYHLREFNFSQFERKFNLPELADKENISAQFKNGVLIVSIPKKEALKPKTINIK